MTGARPGHVEFEYINPGSLERRASLGLKLLAAINGFSIVLSAIPSIPPLSTLSTVAFNIGSAGVVAILLWVALSIDRDRGWAVAAIRPLFVVIALGGLGILALTVADGRVRVPFDVAIAGWVLLGTPDTRPWPAAERRTVGVIAATAGLLLLMTVAGRIFAWGGAFDVTADDLEISLTASCVDGGDTGGSDAGVAPATVSIAFDWRWTTWRPLPSGLDVVVIGWDGDDAAGRPLYFVGQIPLPHDGIYPGLRAYPSADMAADVMTETRVHWAYGIRLDEHDYRPGHIDLELRRAADEPPDPEPLRITATYIHEGVWREDTATITCDW